MITRTGTGRGGGYRRSSASGTTTDAFLTVLDIDMRGTESGAWDVNNTGGSNALNYKVLVRYADYDDGEDVEYVAATEVAAGAKDYVQLEKPYKRVKFQVQSAVAGQATSYSIVGGKNRV